MALSKLSSGLAAISAALSFSTASPLLLKRGEPYGASDATILAYNDLSNAPKPGSAAILLNHPRKYTDAASACGLLHETLWGPKECKSFKQGLNNSLSYQAYLDNFQDDQLFWVAQKSDGDPCRAIDRTGKYALTDCSQELPALCSQSAPIRTTETEDISIPYQVDHSVAGLGTLRGYRDFFVWKFQGVRFAADPGRFEYSKYETPAGTPTNDETDVTEALVPGPDCLQFGGATGTSEDCFFLNIWTPWIPPAGEIPREKLKPVMVYIYGGGFKTGSAKNRNTDGTMIASRGDVVAVDINYRLGALGWLALDDDVHNGNYGLSDMVTALQWIAKHIQGFGGDPERVTIYGESAGAMSVRALMASPVAKGLFKNAISQSGPAGWTKTGIFANYDSIATQMVSTTGPILNQTGCLDAADQLSCLKEMNATELVNTPTSATWTVLDGTYLVTNTLEINGTVDGYAQDVAFLVGTNRNERAIDMDMPTEPISVPDFFNKTFGPRKGADIPAFLASGAFENPDPTDLAGVFNVTEQIYTNGEFICTEGATAYSATKHKALSAVYSYRLNRTYQMAEYTKPWCNAPVTADHPDGDPSREFYKCHAGEAMVVFGTALRNGAADRDGHEAAFLGLVVDYWTSFAWTRNPNPKTEYLEARGYWDTLERVRAAGEWEAFTADKPTTRLLQWDGVQIAFPEQEQCRAMGFPIDYFESK